MLHCHIGYFSSHFVTILFIYSSLETLLGEGVGIRPGQRLVGPLVEWPHNNVRFSLFVYQHDIYRISRASTHIYPAYQKLIILHQPTLFTNNSIYMISMFRETAKYVLMVVCQEAQGHRWSVQESVAEPCGCKQHSSRHFSYKKTKPLSKCKYRSPALIWGMPGMNRWLLSATLNLHSYVYI